MQWISEASKQDLDNAFVFLEQTDRAHFADLIKRILAYCTLKKSHLEKWDFRPHNHLDDEAEAMGLHLTIRGKGDEPEVVIAQNRVDADGFCNSYSILLKETPA